MKRNRYIVYLISVVLFLVARNNAAAQLDGIGRHPLQNPGRLSPVKDSTRHTANTLTVTDSIRPADSTANNTDGLDKPLFKEADQYQLIDRIHKRLTLYDKAHIKYDDIELTAGIIVVDYGKKEVYAGRIPDSTGKLSQRPVFTQGKTRTENDSIRFNFETKKALVWNTYTQEGEIQLISNVTKKVNDSVNFFKDLKITTAEDIHNPEYYILARKGKIVPGKKIVVGTSQMYIEEVPTPLVLPFGYFPLINKRTSGFILPNYGEDQRGFFLQNMGVYLVLSKYADMALLADVYTNGSFGLQWRSNYKKRYQYGGNVLFRYEKRITGEYGSPQYSRSNIWNLGWSHRKDPKSNPAFNFSAHVNIGSSKYFRYSTNQQNLSHVLDNTMQSSVVLSKRFHRIPLSVSLTGTHNQNVNTNRVIITLPQLYAKLDRIYPFAPKSGLKKNAFQRINFDYTFDGRNQVETLDTMMFDRSTWAHALRGFRQSVPLSTNFKLFRYFNITQTASLQHVWYGQHTEKFWDAAESRVQDTVVYKPVQFVDWSLNTSLNTVIYGIFRLSKKGKIKAVRHIITPSLNFTYRPGQEQYKKYYQGSSDPNDWREYTLFDGGMYGRPSFSPQSLLNISLGNTFEAKVRGKDGKDKKVSVLKNLNLSTQYNFNADSMKLGYINLSGNVMPVKGLNLRLTGNLDPYAVDTTGQSTAQYAYAAGQGLVHLRSFRVSTGFMLSNEKLKKWFGRKEKKSGVALIGAGNKDESHTQKTQGAYENPVKWTLNISYSFNYQNKIYHPTSPYFKSISPHTINFNGNVELSPGWRVGVNSGFDITNKKLAYTVLNFRRDLKSWYMTFTWRPLPPYTSWYFYIGIKASVLSDIKYERRKENLRRFF